VAAIEFPALAVYAVDGLAEVVGDPSELGRCGRQELLAGAFGKLRVIGRDGSVWRATPTGTPSLEGAAWRRPFEWLRLVAAVVHVDLEFTPATESLQEIRSQLIEGIGRKKDMWDSGPGSARLQRQVEAAKGPQELFSVFERLSRR